MTTTTILAIVIGVLLLAAILFYARSEIQRTTIEELKGHTTRAEGRAGEAEERADELDDRNWDLKSKLKSTKAEARRERERNATLLDVLGRTYCALGGTPKSLKKLDADPKKPEAAQ